MFIVTDLVSLIKVDSIAEAIIGSSNGCHQLLLSVLKTIFGLFESGCFTQFFYCINKLSIPDALEGLFLFRPMKISIKLHTRVFFLAHLSRSLRGELSVYQ